MMTTTIGHPLESQCNRHVCFTPEADIPLLGRDVRQVPIADIDGSSA